MNGSYCTELPGTSSVAPNGGLRDFSFNEIIDEAIDTGKKIGQEKLDEVKGQAEKKVREVINMPRESRTGTPVQTTVPNGGYSNTLPGTQTETMPDSGPYYTAVQKVPSWAVGAGVGGVAWLATKKPGWAIAAGVLGLLAHRTYTRGDYEQPNA